FLEHSRAFYFRNGGGASEEIYLGSADLMNRNLSRRVEVLFPLEDHKMVRHVKDNILDAYLSDTVKVRRMKSDGTYVRMKASEVKRPRNVQAELLGRAKQPG
ncbi:MAG: RNA degradosome polyphosphate kinase, partial [Acidobacteria bacterium]|nr:RNA degradosome polyphosphate kinase [Acidobacteriota bacterium]